MVWNWQRKDWPKFHYKQQQLQQLEAKFLQQSGLLFGAYKHINEKDKKNLTIHLMSDEALKTSEIEGEYLNRNSVQSSICRHFGLTENTKNITPAERGIADMIVDLYRNFQKPLTHKTMHIWHKMITSGRQDLSMVGSYRTHKESMQVISGPIQKPIIHFEAPPSKNMPKEMNSFIKWFNQTAPNKKQALPALTRSGIAHLYFVSIHPFEDGNGRIGRAVSQKSLVQSLDQPTLIALSSIIEKNKKDYYNMLEQSNKNNEITDWLVYFSQTILQAQSYTLQSIEFLIEKTKLYDRMRDKLNHRQEKVISRIFLEGLSGFKGGLSADNYISITKTSRATATRDLADLVQKDVLLQTGELKSTRYHLNVKNKKNK